MIAQRIVAPDPFFRRKREVADPDVLEEERVVPSTIVLGYDGSDGAKAALDKAVELAKLDGSRIVVVFGSEIPAAYGGETGDYRRAVERSARRPCGGAVERIARRRRRVRRRARSRARR